MCWRDKDMLAMYCLVIFDPMVLVAPNLMGDM